MIRVPTAAELSLSLPSSRAESALNWPCWDSVWTQFHSDHLPLSFYADEVSRRATLADLFAARVEVGQTDFEALLDYAVYRRNLPPEA